MPNGCRHGRAAPGCIQAGECVDVYWGCFKSQNSYNAGEFSRYPLPLSEEVAIANKVVVDALGEGRSIFDPDSQCYPPGMPNRARSAFKLIAQPDRYYFILTGNEFRTICMDGRPMPVKDPGDYTYNGDSIGRWENGTVLVWVSVTSQTRKPVSWSSRDRAWSRWNWPKIDGAFCVCR